MWFFYILECRRKTLYCGITKDLIRRVTEHNRGTGAAYTRSHRPVRLVHWEEFPDQRQAAAREREVKTWNRKKKLHLIKSRNALA